MFFQTFEYLFFYKTVQVPKLYITEQNASMQKLSWNRYNARAITIVTRWRVLFEKKNSHLNNVTIVVIGKSSLCSRKLSDSWTRVFRKLSARVSLRWLATVETKIAGSVSFRRQDFVLDWYLFLGLDCRGLTLSMVWIAGVLTYYKIAKCLAWDFNKCSIITFSRVDVFIIRLLFSVQNIVASVYSSSVYCYKEFRHEKLNFVCIVFYLLTCASSLRIFPCEWRPVTCWVLLSGGCCCTAHCLVFFIVAYIASIS